ncbi:HAD family hydrolase [Promicromonospora sp. NPDC060271]|uniref:HAD family hydrolase n=1 Tax=Promicromonospora sp. NPDC060271 TaxID=3347089 RepID=UPI00365B0044
MSAVIVSDDARALEVAGVGAREAVLIGDSVSDIEVARVVGVHSIGYAKTQQRGAELREAGADALTDTMVGLDQARGPG